MAQINFTTNIRATKYSTIYIVNTLLLILKYIIIYYKYIIIVVCSILYIKP